MIHAFGVRPCEICLAQRRERTYSCAGAEKCKQNLVKKSRTGTAPGGAPFSNARPKPLRAMRWHPFQRLPGEIIVRVFYQQKMKPILKRGLGSSALQVLDAPNSPKLTLASQIPCNHSICAIIRRESSWFPPTGLTYYERQCRLD